MKSTKLMVVIVALQGLILLGQWTGHAIIAPAQAQIPDAGGQREKMIEELKQLNSKMDKMAELLESGKVQVKVASADDKK